MKKKRIRKNKIKDKIKELIIEYDEIEIHKI